MYTVRTLDTEGFRQAGEAWNSLASSMAVPSVFCTWEWVYTWWEHFGEAYDPLILAVYDGHELKGILPLALQKAAAAKSPLKGRVLSYCSSRELYPDHLDIICAGEDASRCLDAVFGYLADEFNSWDVIDISLLSEGSNLLSYIKNGQLGYQADVKQRSTAPFLRLAGSFEDYNKSFDSKQRYNIKSRQKKLRDQFGAVYERSAPGAASEHLRDLFRLHALRAARKNIVSTFQGEELLNFHDALISRLGADDRVWLRLIRTGSGEVIAVLYGFSFRARLFYYQIGIDPEWERYGPGTVLIYEAIKEAYATGHEEFDFLRGNEGYKSSWTSECRDLFALSIYNKTLMASVTKTVSQSKALIKRHVKKLIT